MVGAKLNNIHLLNFQDGIDLSILLGTLVPPNMLMEDDALWTFDSLLRVSTVIKQFLFNNLEIIKSCVVSLLNRK